MESCFIDTAIPAYAIGGPSPYRQPCRDILQQLADSLHACTTSAEVLQELLNLYLRRGDPVLAQSVVSRFAQLLPATVPVFASDVLSAAATPFPAALSSRDRIHVAVMRRLGIETIISTDKDFERVPGIRRLDPLDFESWRGEVFDDPPGS